MFVYVHIYHVQGTCNKCSPGNHSDIISFMIFIYVDDMLISYFTFIWLFQVSLSGYATHAICYIATWFWCICRFHDNFQDLNEGVFGEGVSSSTTMNLKFPVDGPRVLMHVTTKIGNIQDTVDGRNPIPGINMDKLSIPTGERRISEPFINSIAVESFCWIELERGNQQVWQTVDGSEIRRSPVEMVNIPFSNRVLYTIPGSWEWDFWTITKSSPVFLGFNGTIRQAAILVGGTEKCQTDSSRPFIIHPHGNITETSGSINHSQLQQGDFRLQQGDYIFILKKHASDIHGKTCSMHGKNDLQHANW